MPDPVATAVDPSLLEVLQRLRRLEERVDRLEQHPGPAPEASASAEADVAVALPGSAFPATGGGSPQTLAAFGRAFLVLGGAFLLRALAEAGTVPSAVGIGLGLAYASFWLIWAARTGARSPLASTLYGLMALLIAYPLSVEAVTRFQALPAEAGLLIACVVAGAALTLADRRRLPVIAWGATLGALGVVGWSFFGAHEQVAATVAAILLVIATAVVARRGPWPGLEWPPVLAAELLTLILIQAVLAPAGVPESYQGLTPTVAVLLVIGLCAVVLTVAAVSTLTLGHRVGAFEVVLVPMALLVGLGGTAAVVRSTSLGGAIVGAVCAALGLACYGVAFAFVDRRMGRNTTFFYFTSLGLLLVLGGVQLPASRTVAALLWGLGGVGLAALGGWFDRITLRVHAVVFLVAAAASAGVVGTGLAELAATTAPGLTAWLDGGRLVVLPLLVAGIGLLVVADRRRDVGWRTRVPRLAVELPAVLGVGGLVIALVGVAWPDTAEPPLVEALRSVVIAGAALGLAAAGRRTALRELGWLVYPVLAVAGLKLLLVDLQLGHPASLVASFAAIGAALIVVPKLQRRTSPAG